MIYLSVFRIVLFKFYIILKLFHDPILDQRFPNGLEFCFLSTIFVRNWARWKATNGRTKNKTRNRVKASQREKYDFLYYYLARTCKRIYFVSGQVSRPVSFWFLLRFQQAKLYNIFLPNCWKFVTIYSCIAVVEFSRLLPQTLPSQYLRLSN